MKKGLSIFVVLMSFVLSVFAHGEHGQPQYGGIFGEAGVFQTELVAKDAILTIYVTLHGEALSTKGASGKLTILGPDGKMEVELTPAGSSQLVAKLKTKLDKGSKLVATITLPGKGTGNVRYVME